MEIRGEKSTLRPMKIDLKEVKDLAERVARSYERDHGRHWLLWMGTDWEKVNKMSDDDFVRISREVQSWPRKEPEVCSECGQEKD